MIDRLIAALREAQLDLDWRDLADVLWLADVRTRVAAEQEGLPDSDAAIAGQSATDRLGIAQPASPAAAPEVRDAPPTVSAEKARPALAEGVTPLSPARWQLTRQGGAEDSGGLGLEAVAAARYALPGGQEIGRALRPLKQRRRTPRRRVFDPEATVDLFCDTGVLAPVLRPGLERWFDVAVVADIAATMAVWDDTVAAFADLLERHGAFRAVSRWGLRERDGEIEMLTPSGLAHRPHELLDLAGRRLILVVTDAVDELWARTPVWQAVREWGEYGPVALVQLLPPRSWVQTRVGEADAAVMATRPGQPNQQLDVVPPWWWLEREPPEHVVPVVGLDEASLVPWARMVMGAVGVSVPGVVPVPDSLTDAVALEACAAEGGGALGIVPADAGETHGEVDLDRLGNVLRSTVSAQAYRLAVLLSAVEVSLPIARIVMHQLVPQARLAHLAELIAAGVLRAERVPAGSAAHGAGTQVPAPGGTGRPMVALTFAPDLRNLLQRSLTVTMTLQVWRAVGPYLEATQGMPRFSLLLESADLITEPGSVTETVHEGMRTIASDLAIRLGLKPAPTVAEARPADPSAPEVGPPTVWTVDSVVKSVAAVPLPEGRTLLASGSADTTIRLWDPVTGTPLGEPLTGHTDAVNAVAAAELDGRPVVISGSNDATVRLWDPVTGTPLGEPLTGHTDAVNAVAAAELDGRPVVISGSNDATVRLWDPVTGTPLGEPLTGHTDAVNAVAAAELDGRPVVISGSNDATVRLWDPVTGTPLGEPLTGHTDAVNAVAAAELDGRPVVISGSNDATVRLWDPVTGTPLGEPLTGHTDAVNAVAAAELDGRPVVISGSNDATVRLWDPVTGTPLGEPLTGHTDAVNAVAAAELDGRPVVISGSNDATVRVWDPVIAGRVQKALPITPLPPDIFRLLAAAPAPLSPYLKVLAFERLVEERTRNFVGRDYIFRGIDDLLEDPAFPSGYILIRGEPGIGKTALLSQLVKSRGYVHHFNIAPEGIRSTRVFLENVCAQLIVRYQLDYATLPPEASQDSAFLAQLLTEAAEKTADQRVVVLVDALDDAEDIGLPATANRLYLPAMLPQKVFIIVTSREQIDYRLDVNRRQDLYLRDDDPQNLNDVRAYVRSFLHANQEDMTALVGTWKIDPEDFVELLTDKSQGNFMYLVYVLADIRAGKLSPQTVDNIQDLPQGLRSYYQRHWRAMRAEDQDRFERIHEPVLRILAAVREPVTLSAIQEWTNMEPPRIREVIRDWRPFLKEESSENGEPRYRFYHVSFQDFLAEEGVGLKPYHQQTGQQETSNELRRIWQGVAEQGYSLTTDWDIGLPLRFRKDFRELYYDRGQLRADIEDGATREFARDVVLYEWTEGRLRLEEYETIAITDRSEIKGERIHKRIETLRDPRPRDLIVQLLSLVPPERRRTRGTFGIDFSRNYSYPVSKPHHYGEEFIIIYVLERIGDGAETYLYRRYYAKDDQEDGELVLRKQLNAGDILIFDDSLFKHGITSLESPPGETAMRDTIVCTVDYPTTYLERSPVS